MLRVAKNSSWKQNQAVLAFSNYAKGEPLPGVICDTKGVRQEQSTERKTFNISAEATQGQHPEPASTPIFSCPRTALYKPNRKYQFVLALIGNSISN